MSATNVAETAVLELIFKTTTWANLADDTVTSPATTITLSLHTSSPGEAGDMTTNECAYTSYARITVNRGTGFTVSGDTATLAALQSFPAATGGSETATFFGVGTGVSDSLLFFGAITPNIVISSGVTPQLTTGTTITAA